MKVKNKSEAHVTRFEKLKCGECFRIPGSDAVYMKVWMGTDLPVGTVAAIDLHTGNRHADFTGLKGLDRTVHPVQMEASEL